MPLIIIIFCRWSSFKFIAHITHLSIDGHIERRRDAVFDFYWNQSVIVGDLCPPVSKFQSVIVVKEETKDSLFKRIVSLTLCTKWKNNDAVDLRCMAIEINHFNLGKYSLTYKRETCSIAIVICRAYLWSLSCWVVQDKDTTKWLKRQLKWVKDVG